MNADSPNISMESSRLRHDCRNVINQIVGYAEILIDDAFGSAQSVADLTRIRDAAQSLVPMIDTAFQTADESCAASEKDEAASTARFIVGDIDSSAEPLKTSEPDREIGRILIVDDNVDNRDILHRRLTAAGHACIALADGALVLDTMRELVFDLLLLDVMLPDVDGFSILQQIKSDPNLLHVPVIMISAIEDLHSIARCIDAGAADYLTKPFNTVLLHARVGACLREKRIRDREEQLLHEVQASYERERRITEALQGSLIQQIPVDTFPGISIATLYQAAWSEAQVGGDVFDALALPSGKIALTVADASGKGLAAATRIAQVKYAFRAYAREHEANPELIAARLNNLLADTGQLTLEYAESFVAFCLAILDPASGRVDFVCAGCEPPIIVRSGATDALEIGAHALPLGVAMDAEYEVAREMLAPGDTILMCTDGITESRFKGEYLGHAGMIALASEALSNMSDVTKAADMVMEAARLFGGGSFRDDACLLLAQRAPA